jgi:LacI family transcriptional regulator
VVNGHASVADTTRRVVLDAVARVGYRPSKIGRALAIRRTDSIGLLVAEITDPYFLQIVRTVEHVGRSEAIMTIICTVDSPLASSDEDLRRLVDHGIDGLIVAAARPEDTHLVNLRKQGLPVTLIDRRHPAFSDSYVVVDNYRGGQLATEHLVELGHERIAHIAGPRDFNNEIENGYRDTLEQAGLGYARVLRTSEYSPEAGRNAASLFDGPDRPTACFVGNDYTAIGLTTALEERGLRIPDDAAVVGYNDTWFAALPAIGLTSVSVRADAVAERGTRMLIELIRSGEVAAPPETLQPALVVRRTSGAGAWLRGAGTPGETSTRA